MKLNDRQFLIGYIAGNLGMFVSLLIFFSVLSPPEPVTDTSLVEVPAHTNFSSPSSEVASIESATLIMNVSAYCICEKCCSKKWADGITASGRPAVGRICAAPPEYAFGTVFDVEGYGEWVVQDRGGAITGNKLDLLMDSHGRAILFGRQYLKVRIVSKHEN